MIKWILHYKPIYTTFDADAWAKLSEEQQSEVLDINYMFAVVVLFHTLDEFQPEDFYPDGKFKRVLDDLIVCMRLGTYNEQSSAILFDAITTHYDCQLGGDDDDYEQHIV